MEGLLSTGPTPSSLYNMTTEHHKGKNIFANTGKIYFTCQQMGFLGYKLSNKSYSLLDDHPESAFSSIKVVFCTFLVSSYTFFVI